EGNRIDHVLANMFLTFHKGILMRFINGNQISWVSKGPATVTFSGIPGDLLSLIPLSETVIGIDTTNLHYQLSQGTLFLGKSRGISNVLIASSATVSFTRGVLLFVHTLTETSK
ncbi:MAG: thiamine diphosphokinase, partial [Patescibacteria group bacterium]|nr:thiamine diphosphokinase [Patescibacteria group bacterium]